jgi:hypothetical protein
MANTAHTDTSLAVGPSQLIALIEHKTSRLSPDGRIKPMLAPFIWGAPGIGKTDIVRSIARSRDSRTVALHLPQYDPTDLKGIPVRSDDGAVRWVPSIYLPQQHRVLVDNPHAGLEFELNWEYAISLAIYVFDRDGVEIARYNDPVLPASGTASLWAERIGLNKWRVSASLPDDAYEVIVEDKAVVFLDELSAADPSTQNAALQLVLDRRVGEYDIPHSVPIIAAGNREEDGAFVQTLSHPLCNRFAHFTLIPNVDDWIEWGIESDTRPEILGMIKANPDALFDYSKDVQDTLVNGQYGFSTPRSWRNMSDQYADIEFFESIARGSDVKMEANRLRLASFAGIVGKRWASVFVGYLQIMHDLPSPDDIMNGRVTKMKDVERSHSFGLLFSLVQKVKWAYKTHYNPDLPRDQQSDEWVRYRDNLLDFITNNFDIEAGTWAGTVIFRQTEGNLAVALRSDAMLRFSEKFVHTMTRMGRGKSTK